MIYELVAIPVSSRLKYIIRIVSDTLAYEFDSMPWIELDSIGSAKMDLCPTL